MPRTTPSHARLIFDATVTAGDELADAAAILKRFGFTSDRLADVIAELERESSNLLDTAVDQAVDTGMEPAPRRCCGTHPFQIHHTMCERWTDPQ